MVFDFSIALTWILFLALFPLAFFWLRRAWRILYRRDFSEVALKGGEPPADAERWAPHTGIANLVAIVLFWAFTALFADFIISRHAHKTLGKGAAR